MIPKYRWWLDYTDYIEEETEQASVNPIYGDSLAIDNSLESGQAFLRKKINGKLKFAREDYRVIANRSLETQFTLTLEAYIATSGEYAEVWKGKFTKPDCEFDADNEIVTVTPNTDDEYTEILAGLDKEYDLIELLAEMKSVKIDKRMMIQVYSLGDSVVGCFLAGMYWEEECEEVDDTTAIEDTYFFDLCGIERKCIVSGTLSPDVAGAYYGTYDSTQPVTSGYSYTNGDYKFVYAFTDLTTSVKQRWSIQRVSDSAELWYYEYTGQTPSDPTTFTMSPVSGSGASGTATVVISLKRLYARLVLDVDSLLGTATEELPADDMVKNNRNYRRCMGYSFANTIYFSDNLSATPTKYGLYQPGQYYAPPELASSPELFPVAKSQWDELSIWFAYPSEYTSMEQAGRKSYTLRDAYTLKSVLLKLLQKANPYITAIESDLLDNNTGIIYFSELPELLITPKSNVLAGEYDTPAQKAPITLGQVLDMLRNTLRAYWHITGERDALTFHIEHIWYYNNGGAYSGDPLSIVDLTTITEPRNGKALAYGQNKFYFDGIEMPERYQFGWMDEVTEIFTGVPIDMTSIFVNKGNTENVNVARFTSDVDYMLLNPGSCDEDGLALLGAESGYYVNPSGYYQTLERNVNYDVSIHGSPSHINLKIRMKRHVSGQETRFDVYLVNSSGSQTQYVTSFNIQGDSVTTYTMSIDVPSWAAYVRFRGTTSPGYADLEVLGAETGIYALPYATFEYNDYEHEYQNGLLAFFYLQWFYMYDLPGLSFNGDFVSKPSTAVHTKFQKKQDIVLPSLYKVGTYIVDFPLFLSGAEELPIKTGIGTGKIEKLSINLQSGATRATLAFETEENSE